MSEEHPFERLGKRKSQIGKWSLQKSAIFEERCVKLLLRQAKLQKQEGELRDICVRQTGHGALKLPIFCERFAFPVKLDVNYRVGRKLNQSPMMRAAFVFAHFLDLPFVKAYEKYFANTYDEASDPYLGLVFPYKGLNYGLVIHDAGGLENHLLNATVWLHHRGGERSGRLYVQPFDNFVTSLVGGRNGWQPS